MARFWMFFLAVGFLIVFSLSRYALSSLSKPAIFAEKESVLVRNKSNDKVEIICVMR